MNSPEPKNIFSNLAELLRDRPIDVINLNAPRKYERVVKEAVCKVDLDEAASEIKQFHLLYLQKENTPIQKTTSPNPNWFSWTIGQQIWTHISDVQREIFVPVRRKDNHFCDFFVVVSGVRIEVYLRAMKKTKENGTTIYYSPHEPKLAHGAKKLKVAFTAHAIRDAIHRWFSEGWDHYVNFGDFFAAFYQCMRFDPLKLPSGKDAFTFYDECVPGELSQRFVEQILGQPCIQPDHFYFRIGYCPTFQSGNYVAAKTILSPGFTDTPEQKLLSDSSLSEDKKNKFNETLKAEIPSRHFSTIPKSGFSESELLQQNENFVALRWCHEHGVPQVIESDEPLYKKF